MPKKIIKKLDVLPEHIRQAIDLLAAVIRRIDEIKLDKQHDKSLCIKQIERSMA